MSGTRRGGALRGGGGTQRVVEKGDALKKK